MPNFDKTGPAGAGSMTGKGRGACTQDNNTPQNFAGGGRGMGCRRGRGMGRGMGQGMGCCRNPSLSLDEQEKMLQNQLEAIRKLKESNSSES